MVHQHMGASQIIRSGTRSGTTPVPYLRSIPVWRIRSIPLTHTLWYIYIICVYSVYSMCIYIYNIYNMYNCNIYIYIYIVIHLNMCNMILHLNMCNLYTYILYQHVRLLPQDIQNDRTMFDFSAFHTHCFKSVPVRNSFKDALWKPWTGSWHVYEHEVAYINIYCIVIEQTQTFDCRGLCLWTFLLPLSLSFSDLKWIWFLCNCDPALLHGRYKSWTRQAWLIQRPLSTPRSLEG